MVVMAPVIGNSCLERLRFYMLKRAEMSLNKKYCQMALEYVYDL